MAGAFQRVLQRVEHLGAHAHRLAKARSADGRDHELLHVDGIVGVGPAIDDVHLRHRQQRGLGPAEITVERKLAGGGLGLGGRQRHAENRIGAEPLLVLGAVELAQTLVEGFLVGGVRTLQGAGDLAIHRVHGLAHPLAAIALAAVPKLMGLMRAGGRTGRHGGAAEMAVLQHHVDLDGGVAAAVEDFPGEDGCDCGHGSDFGVICVMAGSKRALATNLSPLSGSER